MEHEYAYLLHLLGAYLRQEEPEQAADIDWVKLVQLSQIHCVTGILGYMSMSYPICPNAEMQTSLRRLCLNTISVFARRGALAKAMVQELEQAGIEHILMKGYVLRDYYPIPELRTFGDIDIVIRLEDRQRSHALLLALGYQVDTDWEPVFSYTKENELYEMHVDIMEIDVSQKADYRAYFQQMWQHTQKNGEYSCRFTPEFHFIYMLTHIAKHIHGAGAGARMYLDVAAFIRHHGADLNWLWIEEQLKILKLYDFACVVLTAVEDWFGIPSPIACNCVADAVMADFCTFTMEAGVFGHHYREGALAELKHTDQAAPAPRLRQLLRRTFPAASSIQSRYTYLQDKPWLLPAAWVHRLIKTRGSFGKHTREAQEIFRADSAEIRRLQQLTKDIGL